MTKIIGLTGGIGSGKTTLAAYLALNGIPVYNSDLEAKKITERKSVIDILVRIFGNNILENNQINRKALAVIVFNDKEKLNQLNKVIHPLVEQDFKQWLQNHQSFPWVCKESALLIETKAYLQCNITLVVTASLENRIQRTMKRDGITRDLVLQRMNNQLSDNQRVLFASYVINNDDLKEAYCQLDEVLKKLE